MQLHAVPSKAGAFPWPVPLEEESCNLPGLTLTENEEFLYDKVLSAQNLALHGLETCSSMPIIPGRYTCLLQAAALVSTLQTGRQDSGRFPLFPIGYRILV